MARDAKARRTPNRCEPPPPMVDALIVCWMHREYLTVDAVGIYGEPPQATSTHLPLLAERVSSGDYTTSVAMARSRLRNELRCLQDALPGSITC